ncbi:hypothetical protein LG634_23795 [Streptomyces bambusae]|uniref:hypothetical protein n=1 Tax=Streptomyces bambusae TaxID=1550616 RepID=UPI001CFD2720|nr:hypothetical protein [Streptomyces bambusae]MCB5167842.1 hypothetical protein [Streptomyces bambusae]
MAKNKNRQHESKAQPTRSSAQGQPKESVSEPSGASPSPMDMARKGKTKKFGHN